MLTPITVGDVMNAPVRTVGADESCRVATDRLVDAGIGSLVVCENGDPVGIVTDVDVTRLVSSGKDPAGTPVSAFMSSPIVTITAEQLIEEAAKTLREHDIKRLPVVGEDGDVVGIVTTTDLSSYLPHVIRRGRRQSPDESGKRRSVRVDTAYENDDWEYEYRGDESGVTVGDTATFTKTLTGADIEAFAEASGDTNRLHLDEEFARETRFQGRIVHGTLVSGIISAALARLPGLTIYLSQELEFRGPVSIGDRVTAVVEVVEALGNDQYRLKTTVECDDDVVVDGEATVLVDEFPDE